MTFILGVMIVAVVMYDVYAVSKKKKRYGHEDTWLG